MDLVHRTLSYFALQIKETTLCWHKLADHPYLTWSKDHKVPFPNHHSNMTESGDNNAWAIRDTVKVKQSYMVAELTKKLEMLTDEMNHTRDLANSPSQLILPSKRAQDSKFLIAMPLFFGIIHVTCHSSSPPKFFHTLSSIIHQFIKLILHPSKTPIERTTYKIHH